MTEFDKELNQFASRVNTEIRNCGTELRQEVLDRAQADFAKLTTAWAQLPKPQQEKSQKRVEEAREWLAELREAERRRRVNAS